MNGLLTNRTQNKSFTTTIVISLKLLSICRYQVALSGITEHQLRQDYNVIEVLI